MSYLHFPVDQISFEVNFGWSGYHQTNEDDATHDHDHLGLY